MVSRASAVVHFENSDEKDSNDSPLLLVMGQKQTENALFFNAYLLTLNGFSGVGLICINLQKTSGFSISVAFNLTSAPQANSLYLCRSSCPPSKKDDDPPNRPRRLRWSQADSSMRSSTKLRSLEKERSAAKLGAVSFTTFLNPFGQVGHLAAEKDPTQSFGDRFDSRTTGALAALALYNTEESCCNFVHETFSAGVQTAKWWKSQFIFLRIKNHCILNLLVALASNLNLMTVTMEPRKFPSRNQPTICRTTLVPDLSTMANEKIPFNFEFRTLK